MSQQSHAFHSPVFIVDTNGDYASKARITISRPMAERLAKIVKLLVEDPTLCKLEFHDNGTVQYFEYNFDDIDGNPDDTKEPLNLCGGFLVTDGQILYSKIEVNYKTIESGYIEIDDIAKYFPAINFAKKAPLDEIFVG